MGSREFANVTTADSASRYLEMLVNHERVASGANVDVALRSIGRRAGIGYWTAWGLYHRRRKEPSASLTHRLRDAYLKFLSDQVGAMTAEIHREKTLGNADVDLEGMAIEVAALAKRVAAARQRWAEE